MLSQDKLIEKRGGLHSLGGLSVGGTDQIFYRVCAKAFSVDDTEHASVLTLLAMLVEHKECHSARAQVLCEVAQVHESALCEECKFSVTEPDKEAA